MIKKISKTIALIVFVVFIGTMRVHAVAQIDYGRTCYYQLSPGGKSKGTVEIELDKLYNAPVKVRIYVDGNDKYKKKGSVWFANWGSGSGAHKDSYRASNSGFYASNYIIGEVNKISAEADKLPDREQTIENIQKLDIYKNTDICPKYVLTDQYDPNITDDGLYIYFANDSASEQDARDSISNDGFVNNDAYMFELYDVKLTEKGNAVEWIPPAGDEMPHAPVEHASVNYSNVGIIDDDFTSYSCGDGYLSGIPAALPKVTRMIYNFIMVLVPIVLVILGTLDLVKAIAGQKDDEITKGRIIFAKRCMTAFIIFFVFAAVKLILSFVSKDNTRAINCAKCFLSDASACEADTDAPNRGDVNMDGD